MNESDEFISHILDVNSLPALPQTLVELIDECNKHDVEIDELGKKVAQDVLISTRVLQLVNSAFIGARATFSDIIQAVIYLGVDSTRNLVVSVAVHETFKSVRTSNALDLADFWRHSLLTAVLAKSLALLVGGAHPAEAYLTGLLHDVGKLLLLNEFPAQYSALLQEENTSGDLEIREKKSLQITHSEAAAFLIRSWHLQPEIARTVSCHHLGPPGIQRESAAAKILFCANLLSHCPLPDISTVAENVCEILKMDYSSLSACSLDSVTAADEIAEYMGMKEGHASGKGKKNPPSSEAANPLAEKVFTFSRLNGFLDNLVKAENVDAVFRIIEESLSLLFAADGCLFLLPTERGGLKGRCSPANPLSNKVQALPKDIEKNSSMLALCLEHLGLVDSFAFAKEKGLSEVDRSLLSILGTSGMIVAPIVIAGHSPGVLVIGVNRRSVNKVHNGKETLLLLTGYSGMRFRMEKTYRRHASELAATRVQAVTDIAKTLAHEINNPIATLQNYLLVLGVKLKSRPDLAADLKIIEEEIDRIGQISEQLRDLSNKEEQLQFESVDLNILLSDVVTFFRLSLAQKRGVDLGLSQQGEIPVISSNGLKIRQILGNLIKNAIEAVGSEGMVEVRTELSGTSADPVRKVKIFIEDNGPGISFANIEDAFLPGITTKKEDHAGLGLAIAQKLVKQIGGELHSSKRQQGGMIFTLSLPV